MRSGAVRTKWRNEVRGIGVSEGRIRTGNERRGNGASVERRKEGK